VNQSPVMAQCIAFGVAAMGRYTREFASYVELPSCCQSRLCQMPCGAQLDRRDGQHAAHHGARDNPDS